MLNRDFTKSNKHYFKSNLIPIICVAVFLFVGILIASIFGMNGNFETNGYNELSITIGSEANVADYKKDVKEIINTYGGCFDTISVYDEGDDTRIVIRYMNELSNDKQVLVNAELVNRLADMGVEHEDISTHEHVGPIVTSTHYIYTVVAILAVMLLSVAFNAIRYNGASVITNLIACVLGTAGYISLGAILRLECGISYFALLVLLNVLITFNCINIFENIRQASWLNNKEYAKAIKDAVDGFKFRAVVLSGAIFVIALLLVAMAPSAVKYVSLNIMFMAVSLLAVTLYVVPFIWSVLITHTKIKNYKVKEEAKEIAENK